MMMLMLNHVNMLKTQDMYRVGLVVVDVDRVWLTLIFVIPLPAWWCLGRWKLG